MKLGAIIDALGEQSTDSPRQPRIPGTWNSQKGASRNTGWPLPGTTKGRLVAIVDGARPKQRATRVLR